MLKVLLRRDHKVEVVVFIQSYILGSSSPLFKTTVPGNIDACQGAVESKQRRSFRSWSQSSSYRSKDGGRTNSEWRLYNWG